jgi:transposase
VTRKITKAAAIRFEIEPGRQAQVDWKEFGKRGPFVRFTTSMDQSTLLACHVLAFSSFGGVPCEILYDNMRTAFAPDADGLWQPTKRLLAPTLGRAGPYASLARNRSSSEYSA